MSTKSNYILVLSTLQIVTGLSENHSDVNCTEYRDKFSKYVSHFTACAISNSRPITLCESCVDIYLNVTESYKNMSVYADGDGPCINNYINLDRLQILESMYESSYNLWNRAKCNECFTIENGSLTHNRSENTIKFNELLNDTFTCLNTTNGKNNSVICNTCMDKYLKLNDYYYHMINENDKIAGCMDIVDLMNGTRSYWSKTCCLYRKKSEYIFIASTIIVCVITLLFYVLAKVCADKKTPSIFQQSRFAVSLNSN